LLHSPERHGRSGESGIGHLDAGPNWGYRYADNELADIHAASVLLKLVSMGDGARGASVDSLSVGLIPPLSIKTVRKDEIDVKDNQG
jgi:hypothetical protein